MQQIKSLEADVLVIGTGGAGARAAIEATKYCEKVILAAKGPMGRCGLTPMTMPGICAALGIRDEDNPEHHYQDMLKGGYYLNDPKICRLLADTSPSAIHYLENIGVRFNRGQDGKIEQYPASGHSYRRNCSLADNQGRILLNALASEVARSGVHLMEEIFILDLLKHDGEVVGATAIDMISGKFLVIRAKSVIVATGGFQAVYTFATTDPRTTGDGHAWAYNAGAEMINMEIMQFNPYAIVFPEGARGLPFPANETLLYFGVIYRNNLGEAFLSKYSEKAEKATRDIKSRATYLEIKEGRGGPHGGVYLDCSQLHEYQGLTPEKILADKGSQTYSYVKAFGVDMLKENLEIAPAAHFALGGIKIDEQCRSTIPGLFAAGEVTGGAHGANRLAAAAMAEIFSFGGIVGQTAGRYAQNRSTPDLGSLQAQITKSYDSAFEVLYRQSDGPTALEAKEKLQKCMYDCLGPVTDAQAIQSGLETLASLEKELPRLKVHSKELCYNMDWFEALELSNMCLVSKIALESAKQRKESRGCFYRSDYPDMHADFQRNTVVKRENGAIAVSFGPLLKHD